jgi:hypothetical protein
MKEIATREAFDTQFVEGIKGKIGNYENNSKRIFRAASQAEKTVVVYFCFIF